MRTIEGLSARWAVYAICHPETGRAVYIGKTIKPLESRLGEHIRNPCSDKMRAFIRIQMLKGLLPVIVEIESGAGPGWAERERFWIAAYRADGHFLLNITDGGEGLPGYVPTPEQRAKTGAKVHARHEQRRKHERAQHDKWVAAGKPKDVAALLRFAWDA